MCFPTISSGTGDRYMGHGITARAFTKYFSLCPTLHPFYVRGTSPFEEPLDIYIARIIHFCQIPEIIPYIALYFLTYATQTCHCRRPHISLNHPCPNPSKVSHLISQATTRTPFSRIRKSHWSAAHVFMGAFMIALQCYRITFPGEDDEFCCWRRLPELSGISEEELGDISTDFKECLTYDLQLAINTMRCSKVWRKMHEVDCPFALARRNEILSIREKEENGDGHSKRRWSLKRSSIGKFWKSKEKVMLDDMTDSEE